VQYTSLMCVVHFMYSTAVEIKNSTVKFKLIVLINCVLCKLLIKHKIMFALRDT